MSKVPTIKTSIKRLSGITIEDLRTLSNRGLKHMAKVLPHVLITVSAEMKQRTGAVLTNNRIPEIAANV